jgi:hypothetical protein
MTTPIAQFKFNEASSGTTPTTVADSVGTNSLALTYGTGGTWTTITAGKAFQPGTGGVAKDTTPDSAFSTVFSGGKKATFEAQLDLGSSQAGWNNGGCGTFNTGGSDGILLQFAPDTTAYWIVNTSAGEVFGSLGVNTGAHVVHVAIDTTLASGRIKVYLDGTIIATDDSLAQNVTLAAINSIFAGGLPGFEGGFNVAGVKFGWMAFFDVQLGATEIASRATALSANNDAAPGVVFDAAIPRAAISRTFLD